jgi:hypothetical protein
MIWFGALQIGLIGSGVSSAAIRVGDAKRGEAVGVGVPLGVAGDVLVWVGAGASEGVGVAVAVMVAVAERDADGVAVSATVPVGVAVADGEPVAVLVWMMVAVLVAVPVLVAIGWGLGVPEAVGIAGVIVDDAMRVAVAVARSGQPLSASSSALTNSLTVAAPSPFSSSPGQERSGAAPSAMVTSTISSLIVSTRSPSQSPTHTVSPWAMLETTASSAGIAARTCAPVRMPSIDPTGVKGKQCASSA